VYPAALRHRHTRILLPGKLARPGTVSRPKLQAVAATYIASRLESWLGGCTRLTLVVGELKTNFPLGGWLVGLRPNPEVIARRLDNATVVVDVPTSRIFELNETGTRVWELLGEGLDQESIVRQLVAEFDVERIQAVDEVKTLLERLRTEGLLVG
jgi:hypothetical protein